MGLNISLMINWNCADITFSINAPQMKFLDDTQYISFEVFLFYFVSKTIIQQKEHESYTHRFLNHFKVNLLVKITFKVGCPVAYLS